MNDEERSWQRITDVVREVAQAQDVHVPAALERVSGDYWQRNQQKRQALDIFADQVETFPRFTTDAPVQQIADELDGYWLESQSTDEEDA